VRRRHLLIIALGMAAVAYAAASVRRLEATDRLYVIDAPLLHLPPRVVERGRRILPRGLWRLSSYPSGPAILRIDLSGERAAASREGAKLEVEVDLTYEIEKGRLLDLHRARGPGYEKWLEDLAAGLAAERLRQVPYDVVRNRDMEFQRSVQSAVGDRTTADGVRITKLRIVQVAGAGESSGTILKAAAPPLDREVVLIGVDSFTWRIIDPLMKAGKMPNLARLVGRGARANLRTISPILSPVIWTSIATGVKPSRHGIVDFVVTARDTGALLPVTSAMRQVPAIWNLMSRQGVEVGVIAWWATWPAETVRGRIVTDRVAYELFRESIDDDWKSADPEKARGKTFPPELFEAVRPMIKAPAEVTDQELGWFLPGGRFPAAVGAEDRKRLNEFKTILAAGETYHAIARDLFRNPETRLKLIYYEGPDTTSHLFMRYRPPLLAGVSPAEMNLFGGIVDRYYERQDRFIGEIVENAGQDATILVVSDHGFKSDSNRPPHSDPGIDKGNAADWHTPVGVFVMAGPDTPRGVDIGSASVLDIAPTILALYGLPAARDMDGQPLQQALLPRFLAAHPVTWVDTYGGIRQAPQESPSASSAADAEIVAKLRNIGYIGEERMTAHNNRGVMALDEGDADAAISDFEKALAKGDAGTMVRTNLARAWLQKGDLDKARSYARQAIAEDPKSKQAELTLAGIETKGGDLKAAEEHLRRAIAIDPTFAQAHSQLGKVFSKRGDYEAALAEYQKVIEIAPLSPGEYNGIGEIYRKQGKRDKAAEAYKEALRCDAQYIGAYNNLGLILQEEGRLDEAKALYDKALAIRPENPILRNSMGTLLALKGDPKGALAEFERAVKADPDWPVGQGNIATLLFEGGRFADAQSAFERWVTIEPQSVEARLGLALDLLMTKQQEPAIAQFNEVLKRDPNNVRAHIALGETLFRRGDLDGAQAHLEAAARLDRTIPRVFNSLGDLLVKRGLGAQAADAYRRSLALDPKQPDVRERLAGIGVR
jgi:tetratricopeptide (TPR) repeat protein/arylsulfatase A-like enzyme